MCLNVCDFMIILYFPIVCFMVRNGSCSFHLPRQNSSPTHLLLKEMRDELCLNFALFKSSIHCIFVLLYCCIHLLFQTEVLDSLLEEQTPNHNLCKYLALH